MTCRHHRRLFPEADPKAFTMDQVMPCVEERCEDSIASARFIRPVATQELGWRHERWELRPGQDGYEWVLTGDEP